MPTIKLLAEIEALKKDARLLAENVTPRLWPEQTKAEHESIVKAANRILEATKEEGE